jgi:hypothetical protein
MPHFDPAMRMALAAFNRVTDASIKHMIIISDGDPTPRRGRDARRLSPPRESRSAPWRSALTDRPAHQVLQNIATRRGGKYYVVTNPKALPRIYQREARRVARPLIYEPDGGRAADRLSRTRCSTASTVRCRR